jgi:hypothetical protein
MPINEKIYRKKIFLLTDGVISQPETVINLIKCNINRGNVHTFGIGFGCDKTLVEKAARAGQGSSSLIRDTNNLKVKVINALMKA